MKGLRRSESGSSVRMPPQNDLETAHPKPVSTPKTYNVPNYLKPTKNSLSRASRSENDNHLANANDSKRIKRQHSGENLITSLSRPTSVVFSTEVNTTKTMKRSSSDQELKIKAKTVATTSTRPRLLTTKSAPTSVKDVVKKSILQRSSSKGVQESSEESSKLKRKTSFSFSRPISPASRPNSPLSQVSTRGNFELMT